MNGMVKWLLVVTIALMAGSTHLLARVWSPRRLFFIYLGRELTNEDRDRSRRAVWVNILVSLVAIGFSLFTNNEVLLITSLMLASLVPITWLGIESVRVIRSLPQTKTPGKFVVPLEEQPNVFSYVSPIMQAGQFLIHLVTTWIFVWKSSHLPSKIPMHWNIKGQVDRMASPRELWMFLGIMLFNWLMVWLIAWGISKERWALPTEQTEHYRQLQQARRTNIVRLIDGVMLGTNLGLGLLWVSMVFGATSEQAGVTFRWTIVSVVITMLAVIVPLVVFIPKLMKVQDEMRSISKSDVLGTQNSGWKLRGIIYYAPEDPAVFVPKRFGIGQTFNMARTESWVLLGAIVLLPVALSIGAVVLTK
jgi:uncharacterized membrane protein